MPDLKAMWEDEASYLSGLSEDARSLLFGFMLVLGGLFGYIGIALGRMLHAGAWGFLWGILGAVLGLILASGLFRLIRLHAGPTDDAKEDPPPERPEDDGPYSRAGGPRGPPER